MSDAKFFSFLLFGSCVVAFVTARVLCQRREHWSNRKIMLIAALPLPSLAAAPLIYVIAHAFYISRTAPESCGGGSCATTLGFATVMLGWVVVAFLAALVAASMAIRMRR